MRRSTKPAGILVFQRWSAASLPALRPPPPPIDSGSTTKPYIHLQYYANIRRLSARTKRYPKRGNNRLKRFRLLVECIYICFQYTNDSDIIERNLFHCFYYKFKCFPPKVDQNRALDRHKGWKIKERERKERNRFLREWVTQFAKCLATFASQILFSVWQSLSFKSCKIWVSNWESFASHATHATLSSGNFTLS